MCTLDCDCLNPNYQLLEDDPVIVFPTITKKQTRFPMFEKHVPIHEKNQYEKLRKGNNMAAKKSRNKRENNKRLGFSCIRKAIISLESYPELQSTRLSLSAALTYLK